MTAAIIAAVYTFTATATGLEKGATVEFLLAGKGSDRDYETLFILDRPIGEICRELEQKGLKRGTPTSIKECLLWPEGCEVHIEPALDDLLEICLPEGMERAPLIYTGGTRNVKGDLDADNDQPLALLSFYTLAQAPFLFNGLYAQGDVYSAYKVKKVMKKGDKVEFRLSWPDDYHRNRLEVKFLPGSLKDGITAIRKASDIGELSVLASFSPELSVREATDAAKALQLIDSHRVKLNGVADGDFFYQAFLPQTRWLDRQQRMQQPFEIRFADDGSPRILFIEEDWTVDGADPKLTERPISIDQVSKHSKTDTALLFCKSTDKLSKLQDLKRKLPKSIINWYVYTE